MGIPQEKKKYYNAIRKMFGKKMETAGIVWYKYLNKQEHKNVQNFIIKMRHEIPYMRRFAGDWASAEIVRTILKNDRDEHHKQNLEEDVALHATAFRQRPKRTTLPASTPNSPQSQRRLSSHDGQRSRSSTPLSQPRDGSPQTHHTPPPAPSGGSKRPRTLATDANAAGGDGDGDGDDNDDEEEEEEAPRPKRVCRNRNAAGPSNAGTARGTVTPAGNKKTNTATRPRRKSADASRAGNSSTSRR
ncbi:hypothetical protein DL93DRAFT_2086611 [Clavulina sp. PMI_390]|nr:hypothetical protein DL93DRAFT_2086611 [Clavulina sp. PMI_390]